MVDFSDAFAESNALSAVFEKSNELPQALEFLRGSLASFDPVTPEDFLIRASLAKILRQTVPTEEASSPFEAGDVRVFVQITNAWIQWAAGKQEAARAFLPELKEHTARGSALHLMVLKPWRGAVAALIENDVQEAARLFRRATEVGSHVGVPTNPAIQWSFAASFFEHNVPSP